MFNPLTPRSPTKPTSYADSSSFSVKPSLDPAPVVVVVVEESVNVVLDQLRIGGPDLSDEEEKINP
jgi:hypothetical protein